VRSLNENVLPEEFAQRLAELTDQLAEVARRLELIEGHRGESSLAQQTNLTLHSYDDDEKSIQLLTENGFVIVRPWETSNPMARAEGAFRFWVQDPEGFEREVNVQISNDLLRETALRSRGQIEKSSQFWIVCAERRLANHLMEHAEFPLGGEMRIESLDREDVLMALRWGKTG
jgi:hypothetical protein